MYSTKSKLINSLSGGVGQLALMLIIFVSTPLVIHKLGEVSFGLNSLVTVIINSLIILDCAIEIPLTRLIAAFLYKRKQNALVTILGTGFWLYMGVALTGLVFCFLFGRVLVNYVFSVPAEYIEQAVWIIYATGFNFCSMMALAWARALFNGYNRFDLSNLAQVLPQFLGYALGIYLVWSGYDIVYFVWARTAVAILSTFMILFFCLRLTGFGVNNLFLFDFDSFRTLAKEFRQGLLLRVSEQFLSKSDQFVVSVCLAIAEFGDYSLVTLLAMSVFVLLRKFVEYTLTAVSVIVTRPDSAFELGKLFAEANHIIFTASFLIYPLLFICGYDFLVLWVGSAIAANLHQLLYLLLISSCLTTLSLSVLSYFMMGMGMYTMYTNYLLVKGIFTFLVVYLLVLLQGVSGAGIGMVLSGCLDAVFFVFVVRTKFEIAIFKQVITSLGKYLILAIGIGLFSYGVRLLLKTETSWIQFIVYCGLYTVLYFSGGYLFNVFGDIVRETLNRFLKRLTSAVN